MTKQITTNITEQILDTDLQLKVDPILLNRSEAFDPEGLIARTSKAVNKWRWQRIGLLALTFLLYAAYYAYKNRGQKNQNIFNVLFNLPTKRKMTEIVEEDGLKNVEIDRDDLQIRKKPRKQTLREKIVSKRRIKALERQQENPIEPKSYEPSNVEKTPYEPKHEQLLVQEKRLAAFEQLPLEEDPVSESSTLSDVQGEPTVESEDSSHTSEKPASFDRIAVSQALRAQDAKKPIKETVIESATVDFQDDVRFCHVMSDNQYLIQTQSGVIKLIDDGGDEIFSHVPEYKCDVVAVVHTDNYIFVATHDHETQARQILQFNRSDLTEKPGEMVGPSGDMLSMSVSGDYLYVATDKNVITETSWIKVVYTKGDEVLTEEQYGFLSEEGQAEYTKQVGVLPVSQIGGEELDPRLLQNAHRHEGKTLPSEVIRFPLNIEAKVPKDISSNLIGSELVYEYEAKDFNYKVIHFPGEEHNIILRYTNPDDFNPPLYCQLQCDNIIAMYDNGDELGIITGERKLGSEAGPILVKAADFKYSAGAIDEIKTEQILVEREGADPIKFISAENEDKHKIKHSGCLVALEGETFVVRSEDKNSLEVWNPVVSIKEPIYKLNHYTNGITCVEKLDGNIIAATNDSAILLINSEDYNVSSLLTDGVVTKIFVSENGHLVTATDAGKLSVWDMGQGEVIREFEVGSKVVSFACNEQGDLACAVAAQVEVEIPGETPVSHIETFHIPELAANAGLSYK